LLQVSVSSLQRDINFSTVQAEPKDLPADCGESEPSFFRMLLQKKLEEEHKHILSSF